MNVPKHRERYPSALWRRKGPRWFLLGYLGVLLLLSILDGVLAGFAYLRPFEILIVILYGLTWLVVYKVRPELFK